MLADTFAHEVGGIGGVPEPTPARANGGGQPARSPLPNADHDPVPDRDRGPDCCERLLNPPADTEPCNPILVRPCRGQEKLVSP